MKIGFISKAKIVDGINKYGKHVEPCTFYENRDPSKPNQCSCGFIEFSTLSRMELKIEGEKTSLPILKYFAHDHLPDELQIISKPIGELAFKLDHHLPDGPEKSAGLRKLLEAKDCFVRAGLQAGRVA